MSQKKRFYLVRMISPEESYANSATTMALSADLCYTLWLPSEPMPERLVEGIVAELQHEGPVARQGSAPPPSPTTTTTTAVTTTTTITTSAS